MFNKYGANVSSLNGNFSKWLAESREVETGDIPSAWRRVRDNEIGSNDDEFFMLLSIPGDLNQQ